MNSNGDDKSTLNYSCANWNGLDKHLREFSCEDILKLGASAVTSKFCEWLQIGIDVYIIPHRKDQAMPHSSPRFLHVVLLLQFIEIASFVCNNRKTVSNTKSR